MTEPLQPADFLTAEESAAVDRALLITRDKFLTRVAIYSLRSLRQIAETSGQAIDDKLGKLFILIWLAHNWNWFLIERIACENLRPVEIGMFNHTCFFHDFEEFKGNQTLSDR
ncbi:hypothetical protein H6F67_11390 [Microcoleus sp. FACHB-1515]|uniref:hypothetical protein n=1 Tax=Cyanophyceae TaxID=3028117 RepID=UPI0016852344|nr:hypothetical protein [Microcoleus sp. FACHB-1515]MBD2090459.1 hypothetical protein [Microcoleus sp. FACHB-1515]